MKLPPLLCNILIGTSIGKTVFDVVGYVAQVDGISMQPTLNPNKKEVDHVYLNCWAVRGLKVDRGDIISLYSPKNPEHTLIKRVIGLPGDVIGTIGYKTDFVKVPEGHCWVEGDHTGYSMDSNSFGPISLGLVIAKATCIVWPPKRWQFLNPEVREHRLPLNILRSSVA
ncbi:mitochondrial inner membrane protease subunit 2 [Diprion similis]|uniref:mitochondrial inner membrane protease subunit 2 n=1 Tax=Diprion similis TaxID=362088 RepID=UPI001EF7ED05|nr:mitochondrial inner membrane protease subunit 2 [Diprion similis]